MPKCKHAQVAPRNRTKFCCETLTNEDVVRFADSFYLNTTKKQQDDFLLKHIALRTVKKKTSKKTKKFFASYFVRKNSKDTVKVCKSALLGILGITSRRLRTCCLKTFIWKILGSPILIIYVRFSAAVCRTSPDFRSGVRSTFGSLMANFLVTEYWSPFGSLMARCLEAIWQPIFGRLKPGVAGF